MNAATGTDTTLGPEERAVREAAIDRAEARVEQLLAVLSPRQAAVLRVTKLGGCDVATAARELGISPAAVSGAQARAMRRLRTVCGARSMLRTSEQDAFAAAVRRAREARGLSKAELARTLGWDRSDYSKIERGLTWPSREFARRVDEVLATGGVFQDRHGQPSTDADGGQAVEPRDQAAGGQDEFDDAAVADHDPDVSPAAAACAVGHAAVEAAVRHAQAEDTDAGHAASDQAEAGNDDEQARAAQLARWHADDQETADDSTADSADDWAWSA